MQLGSVDFQKKGGMEFREGPNGTLQYFKFGAFHINLDKVRRAELPFSIDTSVQGRGGNQHLSVRGEPRHVGVPSSRGKRKDAFSVADRGFQNETVLQMVQGNVAAKKRQVAVQRLEGVKPA